MTSSARAESVASTVGEMTFYAGKRLRELLPAQFGNAQRKV